MKLISWNVCSINAKYKKGLLDEIFSLNPDIFCLQEVKNNPRKLDSNIVHRYGYCSYFYPPSKKEYIENGSSGVATYTKRVPITLKHGFGNKFDDEGRIQVIEFEEFNLYNIYFPTGNNSKTSNETQNKYEFYELFTKYVMKSDKPQIICGDFNRGASELDIYNYKSSTNGFRTEELCWFNDFLELGFIDSFRLFNKKPGNYTWWSASYNCKEQNIGARLDYFLVNEELKDNIVDASILYQMVNYDHAPITLELEF